MELFEFVVILSGKNIIDDEDFFTDDFLNVAYEAGCDDASFFKSNGVLGADFAREATSLKSAIESACADLRKVGATIERIEVPVADDEDSH